MPQTGAYKQGRCLNCGKLLARCQPASRTPSRPGALSGPALPCRTAAAAGSKQPQLVSGGSQETGLLSCDEEGEQCVDAEALGEDLLHMHTQRCRLLDLVAAGSKGGRGNKPEGLTQVRLPGRLRSRVAVQGCSAGWQYCCCTRQPGNPLGWLVPGWQEAGSCPLLVHWWSVG
jgi:hypothetical protein